MTSWAMAVIDPFSLRSSSWEKDVFECRCLRLKYETLYVLVCMVYKKYYLFLRNNDIYCEEEVISVSVCTLGLFSYSF